MFNFNKNIYEYIKLYVLAAIITSFVFISRSFFTNYQEESLNQFQYYRYKLHNYNKEVSKYIDTNIIIIKIDELSLKLISTIIGDWPWNRIVYGDLINKLIEAKPRVLFFDIIFDNNRISLRTFFKRIMIGYYKYPPHIADYVSRLIFRDPKEIYTALMESKDIFAEINVNIEDVLNALEWVYSSGDSFFIQEVKRANFPIVFPYIFSRALNIKFVYSYPFYPTYFKTLIYTNNIKEDSLIKMKITPFTIKCHNENKYLVEWANQIKAPFLYLLETGKYFGHVNIFKASKHKENMITLLVRYKNRLYPNAMLITYQLFKYGKFEGFKLEKRFYNNFLVYNIREDKKIFIDKYGNTKINFRGRLKDFYTISLYDFIFSFEKYKEKVKNKIVIVGITDYSLGDAWSSPIGIIPGVLYHANFLNNMLRNDFITFPPLSFIFLLLFLYSIIIFIIFIKISDYTIFSLMIFTLLSLSIPLFSFFILFYKFNIVITGIPFTTATVIFFLVIQVHKFISERIYREKLKVSLSKYLEMNLLNNIMEHPERMRIPEKRIYTTVMYCDINNFTRFASLNTPEYVFYRLNKFYSEILPIIRVNKGKIDKYIGDAIMVVWTDELLPEDQAYYACKSAVELVEYINQRKKEGEYIFDVSIGINTGEVLIGSVGDSEFMDFTIIGNPVNIAAKLEPMCKKFDASILITKDVVDLVHAKIDAKFVYQDLNMGVDIFILNGIFDEETCRWITIKD